MSKIMVIAGGAWQAPLIKKLREMGHYVLCTNLYSDTPGMLLADECVVADVLDKEKNLKIARAFGPDIVLTDQSDVAVPTVAYVSEKMGLPGIGTKMAELFTNKYRMREFERQHAFVQPDFSLCTKYEDATNFLKVHKKAIIKPINSQSSRGIYVVKQKQDFQKEFANAASYTHGSDEVIIEEYIDGTEFTVDGIKLDEQYEVLAISEKKHYGHNPSIASELYFSNQNENYDYEKLREINSNLVTQMGLPFGLTHAEYKYKDGKFVLIEIAARGGGTRISSDIVPAISGIHSGELLVRYLLGEDVKLKQPEQNSTCAVLKFIDAPEGRVKSITGIEKIREIPNVIDIQLDFHVGDVIRKPQDDRTRVGFFIAYGTDKEQLDKTCQKIEQLLKIEIEKV